LAEELHVALVIDEAKAYREAQRRNVPVLRTLAVLDKAAERGLIDLAEAIAPSANKFPRAAGNSGRTPRSRRCSQINSENIAPQVTLHLRLVAARHPSVINLPDSPPKQWLGEPSRPERPGRLLLINLSSSPLHSRPKIWFTSWRIVGNPHTECQLAQSIFTSE
jgi:hypothetical protein